MEIIFIITTLIIVALLNVLIKRRLAIEFFSIIASSVALFESVVVAVKVSTAGVYAPFVFFSVDSLGAIVMLIIACVGFITTIYSVQYLRQETAKGIIGFTRDRKSVV